MGSPELELFQPRLFSPELPMNSKSVKNIIEAYRYFIDAVYRWSTSRKTV
jgi:hypothetical protein